ncbi:MAG: L,D-transpeptidase family protein [Eubacteriales bacterium]|nr:L,D-transpeptidase family protein [Eubacteriales bacterium]
MKRFLCALLAAALTLTSAAAFATQLTGAEALGLVDTEQTTGLSGNYPTLQLGSRDGDDSAAYVVMLQNRLQELGYLTSAADGQYGQMTESAVLAFQETNGLTPTGIADDSTQSILYSTAAKQAPVDTANQDSDAIRLQQKLIVWGFMVGGADGVVGDATKTAVAEFKEYIYASNAALYAAYATPEPTPEPTLAPDAQPVAIDVPLNETVIASESGFDGEITEDIMKFVDGEYPFTIYRQLVQTGDSGAEVWRVQRRLRALGYLYKPDGSYGALTENALKYFQKKNGLQETGAADQATQEKLFSSDALKAEEYVFPYKIGISLDEQRVYVYQWDGSGYNDQIKKFKCSTGMEGYATPTGTYQSGGKVTSGEWYYFADYNCYAKYAYRIVGGILFHSVLYNSNKQGPTNSSVRALGRKASHGCVRLAVDDAKWIFENCPEGTTVIIR